MAAAVDVPYLATHLGVSQDSLTTVATAPTADLVQAILEAVATKAHEYDTLYSEKLQVDIELENVVRSSEARCQTFKVTADNALKEVEEARRKLQAEGRLISPSHSPRRHRAIKNEARAYVLTCPTCLFRNCATGNRERASNSEVVHYYFYLRD